MKESIRYRASKLNLREDVESQEKVIEGYFVVFNDVTELWPGCFEQIDSKAISEEEIKKDIRALFDHDTAKVLGRTANGTLELKIDTKGVYGKIIINDKDQEAVNLYERVKRGDINQCSFGFYIEEELAEDRDDGSVLFTIKKLSLVEVSVVTFPAYANTSVEARKNDYSNFKKRELKIWKEKMEEKLNGIKGIA